MLYYTLCAQWVVRLGLVHFSGMPRRRSACIWISYLANTLFAKAKTYALDFESLDSKLRTLRSNLISDSNIVNRRDRDNFLQTSHIICRTLSAGWQKADRAFIAVFVDDTRKKLTLWPVRILSSLERKAINNWSTAALWKSYSRLMQLLNSSAQNSRF